MTDSYGNTQAARLKEARINAGFASNADAITRFGWAESTYNSHENGNRTFPLKRAKIYARAFKVDPYWLLDGTAVAINSDSSAHVHTAEAGGLIPTTLKLAKIRGYVQAGDWREASEYLPEEMGEMYLKEIELYQNVFGLDVRGDSMNEKFNEGDTLVCVPLNDWGKEPISGQYVIAEATCVAGLKEATVKRYETDEDGHHWLIPDSNNPSHQNIRIPNGNAEALILNGKQIEGVEVVAIVISRVENFI